MNVRLLTPPLSEFTAGIMRLSEQIRADHVQKCFESKEWPKGRFIAFNGKGAGEGPGEGQACTAPRAHRPALSSLSLSSSLSSSSFPSHLPHLPLFLPSLSSALQFGTGSREQKSCVTCYVVT